METAYLGIDVSKGYADFALLSSAKEMLGNSFQLNDMHEGHSKLLDMLAEFKKEHQLAGINAVLESTGGYENNWLSLLKEQTKVSQIRIARINPFAIKHDVKAGMERTITDATSAKRIAMYAMHHPEKTNWEESAYDIMDSLRSMYNYIQTKVKQKVQLQNQLEKLLYTAFPEILKYTQEQIPKWLLLLLKAYPTALAIKGARVDSLQKINGLTQKKAETILQKAGQSVSAADNETLRQLISDYANDILLLMEQIESLKNTLSKQKGITREIEILESFNGIARYSAVGLMIEIEEIERFPSTKKISSFFGLHPKFKQSGDKTSGIKMSKQGSAQVRAILYMVAKSALVYNGHIRKIYDRFKEQGMSHNQAMGVVMHKILRIIYGMLKSNTKYAPAYDLERQQLSVAYHRKGNDSKRSNSSSKKYKEVDLEAPISKRQRRKRKEQLSSPSS